jgi:hypothetical protein
MKRLNTLLSISLALSLCFTAPAAGQDAVITSANLDPFIKTGKSYELQVDVANEVSTKLEAFRVSYTIEGSGNVQTSRKISIRGGGIGETSYIPFKHPDEFSLSNEGTFTLKAWVHDVDGDTNPSNDTITVQSTAIPEGAARGTLFEVVTATWCQYCPPANKKANDLAKNNDDVAIAKFHHNDELSTQAGTNYYKAYYPGRGISTPGGIMNMGSFGSNNIDGPRNQWKDRITTNAGSLTPVKVSADPFLDEENRELEIDLKASFTYADEGDYYVNAYVLESGIDLPQTNASSDYQHDYVVRKMLDGARGNGNVIPDAPQTGKEYQKTYNYAVPEDYDMDKLSVIGIVYKRQNGKTWAANAVQKDDLSGKGTGTVSNRSSTDLKVYPNPFQESLAIEVPNRAQDLSVAVYSMQGKKVHEEVVHTTQSSQKVKLDLAGQSLSKGLYTLKVTSASSTYTKRVHKR